MKGFIIGLDTAFIGLTLFTFGIILKNQVSPKKQKTSKNLNHG
jgi:hypothetical protein